MGMLKEFFKLNDKEQVEYPPQHESSTPEEYLRTGEINPLPILVSGSKTEIVRSRAVYTSTNYQTVRVPKGAKSAYVFYRVHSITGSFGSGEGFYLQTRLRMKGNTIPVALESSVTKDLSRAVHVFGAGISPNDMTDGSISGETKTASIPLVQDEIEANIRFEGGSFGNGEGVELEVIVCWVA